MFKEITEQEVEDIFNISLEQLKREVADGTIKCFANYDNKVFIIPSVKDKPLKIVYDDNWAMNLNGYNAEFSRKLTDLEFKNLLIDTFGTTDVGVLDCNDISDEELNRMLDELNSIQEEYAVSIEEWKRLGYTDEEARELSEHSNIYG